ncbi:hypothetical protein BDV28DRAFT_125778 [Aspergillus coremiiformis]|uniref:Aminoglycoside phosphotransferase domain-containing protein n=1 Tax=Aspergillus coremiiformis TaxID=138285 RepID=A0A5N6Z8Q0_9EURO|nr:hypothetical protein BDV28DRAFT_125778 [Aspergillus coremiiformis]
MPPSRRLLRGEIELKDALEDEANILARLGYVSQQNKFFSDLETKHMQWIREVIAHHFNSSPSAVIIAHRKQWLSGSFNVCIPASIPGHSGVIFRIPLPYRVGEEINPGNADEKIRCEAGTYAWLEKHCPEIPIPKLYGFGMSTGVTFTRLENLPFVSRYIYVFLRWSRSLLGLLTPSGYVRNDFHQMKKGMPGYMIIEFIKHGCMLSNTWQQGRDNHKLRTNLFHDLARILLSFTSIPLPQIGSFIICDDGYLRLANRPLSLGIHELENDNIPVNMPRDLTYSSTHAYAIDLLATHDSRLYHQPNAINNEADFILQASILAIMRMLPPLFLKNNHYGPFFFSLTDLHRSNIFVDEQWHVTCLVDLEWGCTLPAEMLRVPYWLAGDIIDEIPQEELESVQQEFMAILKAEEKKLSRVSDLSAILEEGWSTGSYWYGLALAIPNGLFWLFDERICKLITKTWREALHRDLVWFWTPKTLEVLKKKINDRKRYDDCLRREFEDSPSSNPLGSGDSDLPLARSAGMERPP